MSTNDPVENDVCEACGTFGEIGYIIKEGDNVADVKIMGGTNEALQSELDKYIELAKQVCANVKYEADPINEETQELTARFEFEVSAEKIIFELKSRSLIKE
ncbi:hypothetical protein VA7868_03360 [Vibrio aerogenes CECT 7868]|uniref:DUF406 domain-containing protein n=1 Tax=Vibrio aerogenes CECT 7868 TaxID=1216006 RepID=A0A1M5ZXH3_9VIBR|nr:DUF406 family protein [Vibrio aerogenes]SHI28729.1 hypothetical protein VA7868_03360 [Vibrio aerogenes CECT 7868]